MKTLSEFTVRNLREKTNITPWGKMYGELLDYAIELTNKKPSQRYKLFEGQGEATFAQWAEYLTANGANIPAMILDSEKLNIELVDITKPYNSSKAKSFSREVPGTDIAGIVLDFAKKNRTKPENIRMYAWGYEDWSARCNDYIRTAF